MNESNEETLIEQGLFSSSKKEWERARLRTEVISELAKQKTVAWSLPDTAAKKLNISRKQVYSLITRYRQDEGLVTDMLAKKSLGGKGKSRLPQAIDQIIQNVLKSMRVKY